MADQALSRKDRRAKIAVAAKAYGIKGQESLDLHQAYIALRENNVARAVQLAHPITKSHPKSVHAWIVMGGAALAQREGKTAEAFFSRALEFAPNESSALVGLSKAYVLQAMPEEATSTAARAFRAGADERGLIDLYLSLMHRMGRVQVAIEEVEAAAIKLDDPDVSLAIADMLAEIDENIPAAFWLDRAWRKDPQREVLRIGRLRGLLYVKRHDAALAQADELLADPAVQDRDTVVLYKAMILRITGRPHEAMDLVEGHEFQNADRYAEMRGVMANILQDVGRGDEADAAYLEGMHVTGARLKVAKAYGAYLMRANDYERGPEYFKDRMPEGQRRFIPFENSSVENLRSLNQLYIIGEQGVGDQLALLNLLRIAPVDLAKVPISYVAEDRFIKALAGNAYGLSVIDRKNFGAHSSGFRPNELMYLGDLVRYVDPADHAAHQGPWLTPDATRMRHLRSKYERLANGGPIIGAAWNSGAMVGHLRSVTLMDLLECVPDGALVVNLQYGDCKAEIEAARQARPGVSIFDDPEVNQMTDLAGFFAQIGATDRVLTIDNTTAHACGALGHPDTHTLIPAGSECMWYWGLSGDRDPWYGNLSLYRQEAHGDWSKPLSLLKKTVCP